MTKNGKNDQAKRALSLGHKTCTHVAINTPLASQSIDSRKSTCKLGRIHERVKDKCSIAENKLTTQQL